MFIYQRIKSISMPFNLLMILVSLYFAGILNYPFYKQVLWLNPFSGSHDYFLLTIPLVLFFALNGLFQIIALPYLHKVLIPILIILSAIVAYQELFYGIYFDKNMLQNVLQTHTAETINLITVACVLWVLGFGVLPALLYIMVTVNYRGLMAEIAWRTGNILLSILVIVGIAKFFYQDYASFIRNHKQIVHLIVPSNMIGASISTIKSYYNAHRQFEHIASDAKREKRDNKRRVVVMIMGETTRAKNWGLNGYHRQTTPNLAKRQDIINFQNVSSCGTATAYSIPCLFSNLSRKEFNNNDAPYRENLLDILQRAGVKVSWYDNDAGCKGVCNRVENYDVTSLNLPEYCRQGECLDEILLKDFEQIIGKSEQDSLIVLHTIGSHGPTYYQRYPQAYRQFTPTCDTNEINKCSNAELVNTYDNTILYIDHIINQTIEKLEKQQDIASAVIYVSDHGESLGENGLYLHAAPYAIAPKEQTQVPMVMWFSPLWQQTSNVDMLCLKERAKIKQFSHDHLFHSLANMFELNEFGVYQPELDLFKPCQVKN